jgi:solute carrier family 25 2-oxodicarboxylate transporter 21
LNGLEATLWRQGVWNGVYFGLIFTVKDLLPKSKVKGGYHV